MQRFEGLFDPKDFLSIAKQMMAKEIFPKEANYRTVINRAYYASFLHAYEMMMSKGIQFHDVQRIHRDVRVKLQGLKSRIGNKLEKLHEDFRVPADYFLDEVVCQNEAKMAIRMSELIINSIDKM